ncbi:MAG: hypothetical protein KAW41_01440 [Candidatus Diapherotrites archaeon]|nr:hypothetical protein [Candidatus Diapherotrites archaeon]
MPESLFLEVVGKTPQLRVIDFFIENRIFDYSKSEISEATGVSRMTLDKVWGELVSNGIITETRKIGRATMYKLNVDSPLVLGLIELDRIASKEYADKITEVAIAR